MVQRSAQEEVSLVSQRKEYEKMLTQQRRLYEDKMTELDKLHSQRKVSGSLSLPSPPLSLSLSLSMFSLPPSLSPHTQEYEAELEMLQDQKKSYEAKVEEYEALQLQKKVDLKCSTPPP